MRKTPGRPTSLLLLALFALPQPIAPAVITVEGTDSSIVPGDGVCALREAINNANSDSDTSGGDCAAGEGQDTVVLGTHVTLTVADNSNGWDFRGLPVITSNISLDGGFFTISRDGTAPAFGILEVGVNARLSLRNTTLSGGYAVSGGGVYNYMGEMLLINSTVSDNVAQSGGGITNRNGITTLIDSTVSGNTVTSVIKSGGGIYARGITTLVNSTVTGNFAGWGGGISNVLGLTTLLINSTVSGNSAYYRGGGANVGSGSTMTLINSTVSGNTAGSEGGGVEVSGTLTLTGSIVGDSVGEDCSGFGAINDGGGNFSGDGTCPGSPITPGTDFDTLLSDNGGPTETHALLAGSVAIDAAGDCGLETDQRGVPRDDGACDSGSYEFVSDPCVLRVRLGSAVLQSGESLEVELYLQHNRPKTVTVPFVVWVEDESGAVVASRTTPPLTFKQGDTFRRRMTLALPESIARGRYAVRAKIDQMQQGMAEARRQTLVIE